jgi:hypothetical protein
MSVPPERPSFKQIYRQQYRKDSSSTTTQAFRIITPVVFMLVAVFSRHSSVILIILGVLAVLLIAVAIVWGRRQRRNGGGQAKGQWPCIRDPTEPISAHHIAVSAGHRLAARLNARPLGQGPGPGSAR